MTVLNEVLYVAHFVVDYQQKKARNLRALLDSDPENSVTVYKMSHRTLS